MALLQHHFRNNRVVVSSASTLRTQDVSLILHGRPMQHQGRTQQETRAATLSSAPQSHTRWGGDLRRRTQHVGEWDHPKNGGGILRYIQRHGFGGREHTNGRSILPSRGPPPASPWYTSFIRTLDRLLSLGSDLCFLHSDPPAEIEWSSNITMSAHSEYLLVWFCNGDSFLSRTWGPTCVVYTPTHPLKLKEAPILPCLHFFVFLWKFLFLEVSKYCAHIEKLPHCVQTERSDCVIALCSFFFSPLSLGFKWCFAQRESSFRRCGVLTQFRVQSSWTQGSIFEITAAPRVFQECHQWLWWVYRITSLSWC